MTELTLDRLFASPSLTGQTTLGIKYSPDAARVTFLKPRPDDQQRHDLWQFDVETGAPSLLVDSLLLEPEEIVLSEEEIAQRGENRHPRLLMGYSHDDTRPTRGKPALGHPY